MLRSNMLYFRDTRREVGLKNKMGPFYWSILPQSRTQVMFVSNFPIRYKRLVPPFPQFWMNPGGREGITWARYSWAPLAFHSFVHDKMIWTLKWNNCAEWLCDFSLVKLDTTKSIVNLHFPLKISHCKARMLII